MLNGTFFDKKQGYLITDRSDRKYFTGVDIPEGFVVLSVSPAYFTDARYFSATQEKLKNLPYKPRLFSGLESIKAFLKESGITVLYIDFSHTTLSEYKKYKSLKVKLKNGEDNIKRLRAVKNEQEIRYISEACAITEKAYYKAMSEVKSGITEKFLADKIRTYMKDFGAECESFDTIVAFGKNSAVPHHETDDTVLTENSVILVDTGCKYCSYCSDYTRTAYFGTPPESFIKAYNAVKAASEAAENDIAVGMTFKEADETARQTLRNLSYDTFFTHSLGHGVGLDIHEYPNLSPKNTKDKTTIKENMVFTVEPGVYFDNEFGVRIEDTVVIKDGKIKRLFKDKKDLLTIN